MMNQLPHEGPLWLASRSPRRRELLAEAGVDPRVQPAGIDDSTLTAGATSPAQWVMSLAYMKARWVADALRDAGETSGVVLGADTLCVHDDHVMGQPDEADHARDMLHAMRSATHETMTGVCILSLEDADDRWMMVDRAVVRCGSIDDAEIETYIDSEQWRGKAGGYNLRERVEAGWPIECDGDPATVMGLPMRRLSPWLDTLR